MIRTIPGVVEALADVVRRQGPLPAVRVSKCRRGGWGIVNCEIRVNRVGWPSVRPLHAAAWMTNARQVAEWKALQYAYYDGPVGPVKDAAGMRYVRNLAVRFPQYDELWELLDAWRKENRWRWSLACDILGTRLPEPPERYPYYLRVVRQLRDAPVTVVAVPARQYLYIPNVGSWPATGEIRNAEAIRLYMPHVWRVLRMLQRGAHPEDVRAALQLAD